MENKQDRLFYENNIHRRTKRRKEDLLKIEGVKIDSKSRINRTTESSPPEMSLVTEEYMYKAIDDLTIDIDYDFPELDGNSGEILQNRGDGTLEWVPTPIKSPDRYDPMSGDFPSDFKGSGEIHEGDSFYIEDRGVIGTGVEVDVGDIVVAGTDNPGQLNDNWYILEGNKKQASETSLGIARLATQAKTDAGTNDTDIVTPLKLSTYMDNMGYTNIDLQYVLDKGHTADSLLYIKKESPTVDGFVRSGIRLDTTYSKIDGEINDSSGSRTTSVSSYGDRTTIAYTDSGTPSDNKSVMFGLDGLKFSDDLSSLYSNRSIVDKEYVDITSYNADLSTHSVTELNDVTSSGSGDIITTLERDKLNNIEDGAEVNVQSDWNSVGGDSFILNKPTDITDMSLYNTDDLVEGTSNLYYTDLRVQGVVTQSYVNGLNIDADTLDSQDGTYYLDYNNFTSTPTDVTDLSLHSIVELSDVTDAGSGLIITDIERDKLSNIESGAEVNVQADWNQTDTSDDSYILNKPTGLDNPLNINNIFIGDASNEATQLEIGEDQLPLRLSGENLKAGDITQALEGNATLVSGQYTITDTRITVDSIVQISESTVGFTTSVPTRYTLSSGQCVFSNSDVGNASGEFSYKITL